VCASPTAATLAWRVRNPNRFPVDYNAEVQGVRQLRLGTVPAKTRITFTTDRVAGTNTVHLYVGGRQVDSEHRLPHVAQQPSRPPRESGAAAPSGALRAIEPCRVPKHYAGTR
jgi:hypothetical protein